LFKSVFSFFRFLVKFRVFVVALYVRVVRTFGDNFYRSLGQAFLKVISPPIGEVATKEPEGLTERLRSLFFSSAERD